jgi:Sodium/hydrogen exchanger family
VTRDSVQVGVAVTLAGVRVVSGRVENRQGTWRSSRRFLSGLAMFLTLPRGLRGRRPLGIRRQWDARQATSRNRVAGNIFGSRRAGSGRRGCSASSAGSADRGVRVCGLSHRGRGAFRSESADRPCHWQADCCCSVCWVRSPGGPGCRTYRQLTALADRLADISAQIRIRLTVLLAAGIALGAAGLGFEAILGAFTAGVLVRMLDPSPNWPIPVTDQAGSDQLRPADPGLSRRGRSAPQHSGCR